MRSLLAAAVALSVVLLLAGCTPPGVQYGGESPSASAPASASPTTTPDEPVAVPVPTCEELVPADTMYEYNSNVALTSDYAPPVDGIIDRVAETGIACGWVNLSSGDIIAVAAGAPHADALAAFEREFGAWGAQQWAKTPGHFSLSDHEGHAAAIVDGYVVLGTSSVYVEAADASSIVESAVAAL